MRDHYRHRRVLILGGLGFIGSNLALKLAEAGAELTLVDCLLPEHGGSLKNVEEIRDQVRIVIADVRNAETLEAVVPGQEVIYSLAAQASHIGSMRDPMTDLDVNCRAQLGLLECCRRHNPDAKIVFTSTRQVYGRPQRLPVDEHTPIQPVDANGVSKCAAEMYYALYCEVFGVKSVVLRLTNTYGPRMNLRGAGSGFIGNFILKALTNTRIDVFGTGRQRRDFNYIDDVVDALLRAGRSDRVDGQAFNLGHPEHHSILDLVHLLQHLTGATFRVVPFPEDYAVIDVGDCYCDFSKFREATGWMPRHNLAAGLARTLDFFNDDGTDWEEEADHDSSVRCASGIPAAEAGN
uniref:NAD-dependent epimerase/dehydratase family protein n=1 Tax=Schlesneria paludicola TaxID=360056 RepID=A0A7C2NYM3_9PLAN